MSVDIISYPIDTIKTRIQASVGQDLKKTIQNTNKSNLYRGLSSNMIVSFPSAFSYFMGYDATRHYLKKHHNNVLSDNSINMLGGMAAEVCANTIRTPFEIVKQQMQVGLDTSIKSTFQNIHKIRGFRGTFCSIGLYAGFGSLIIREIPFSAIQMPIYEAMKRYTRKNKAENEGFTFFEKARQGVVAGSIGNAR